MSKNSKRTRWVILAAILLAFPLYAGITWIALWKAGLSQAENVARYLKHFPSFLQNPSSITWVALAFNITANALTIGSSISKKTKARWLSIVLLLIGIPLMPWSVFTLI